MAISRLRHSSNRYVVKIYNVKKLTIESGEKDRIPLVAEEESVSPITRTSEIF